MTQERAINDLSDRLNELSARLKSREHSATVLEGVCARMFDALFGWKLRNLNQEQGNFPGVDLGDEPNGIAIQVTVHDQSEKAAHTIEKIESAKLRDRFACFLCFFLVPKAPGSRTPDPSDFHRWGIRVLIEDILKPLRVPEWLEAHVPSTHHIITLERLREALRIVEETLGALPSASPRPNNLPFRANPHFGHRQQEMQALKTALAHTGGIAAITQPQVVHGLGGVGKTQLAIQYAWQHADSFTALLWLPADSLASIVTGLARLSETLGLPQQGEREDTVRAEATRRWLKQTTGWLLIADNADTIEGQTALLQELRPLHGGRILITSRLENWGQQAASIPLHTWMDAQGAAWLQSRLDTQQLACPLEDAAALSHELGGLPLALEQAAAYMTDRRIGPGEYLRRYQAHEGAARRFLDSVVQHGGGTGYEATVATTWLVTLDQLNPVARTILKLVAWLGVEEIPRTLFSTASVRLVELAKKIEIGGEDEILEPEDAIENGMALLARFSLVKLNERTIACHRLVQRTQQWEDSELWLLAAIALVNKYIPDEPWPDDIRSWPSIWLPLIDSVLALFAHLRELKRPLKESDLVHLGWSRVLNGSGIFLMERAAYAVAEPILREALRIDEVSHGAEHPKVGKSLAALSVLLNETGRYAEAETLMRRGLQIETAAHGLDHPNVGRQMSSLGCLLMITNRLDEAESFLRQALEIIERHYGESHSHVAIQLSNLAQLLRVRWQMTEAIELTKRALAIGEKEFGGEHPRTAVYLNNLAQLLLAVFQFGEAERLMRRALQIDQQSYGANHPKVATDLHNLAQLLRETGEKQEAERLVRCALAINEECFGRDHAHVALDLNDLGALLLDQGHADEAVSTFERALKIRAACNGGDHPSVAQILVNLAAAHFYANNSRKAESLLRRALEIERISYGASHPDTAATMDNLATLLSSTGQSEEVESLRAAVVISCVRHFGLNDPRSQRSLASFRNILAEQQLTSQDIEERVAEVLERARRDGKDGELGC
ncbi:MAG: tetratricopeptide repeat protein [Verrucomicrobiaceae bacterium]|nr:tetratricopeptide repeat protein [Verrucomicrobiaceae bacterium]